MIRTRVPQIKMPVLRKLPQGSPARLKGFKQAGGAAHPGALPPAKLDGGENEKYNPNQKPFDGNKILYTGDGASIKEVLERAVKEGADLSEANLSEANLSRAKNVNKYLTTPLYMLLDQPGKIRAYKLVNNKNEGIYNGGIVYEIGKEIVENDFDDDELNECGKGIHLATLYWCMQEWLNNYKILICEFTKDDIAAIPIGSDGKFRVKKCTVVAEKDLKEIGLIK